MSVRTRSAAGLAVEQKGGDVDVAVLSADEVMRAAAVQ
jgi:Na+/citrate or Na+/malate symporter